MAGKGDKMYYVYMLRCNDNSIYTGITTDIERRMNEHFRHDKKCAKYTLRHLAKKLEMVWEAENRVYASKLEYYIKKLLKSEKEELIINKNLQKFLNQKLDCEKYKTIDINTFKIKQNMS